MQLALLDWHGRFDTLVFVKIAFALIGLLGLVPLATADEATFWNQLALKAIEQAGQAPPMVARNLAIASIAQADAVNSISGVFPSYAYSGSAQVSGASKEAAVAAAAYQSLSVLFPNQKSMFDAAWASRSATFGSTAQVQEGIRLGAESAQAILVMRATDGAASANYVFNGSNDIGSWRPTGPAFKPGVLPGWGNVTPFVIQAGAQFRPATILQLTSDQYADAYNEVATYGAINSSLRTSEMTQTVDFWAANAGTVTPPGMWNQIAANVGSQQGNSLEDNVRMFGMLNAALADAGIAGWDTKYAYSMWRPETAIANGDLDGNDGTSGINGWAPYMITPNHPTCVSGHSTFSSAGATVLASFFGTDQVQFSLESAGYTRSFDSLFAAAEEAGQSRIYGGIHFQFDNQMGLSLGSQVGAAVAQNGLTPTPEPATIAGLGLAVGALLRRRKSKNSR